MLHLSAHWGDLIEQIKNICHIHFKDKTKQDNFITFLHNTVMADLASHVAEANRGGPGTIKTNEICEP